MKYLILSVSIIFLIGCTNHQNIQNKNKYLYLMMDDENNFLSKSQKLIISKEAKQIVEKNSNYTLKTEYSLLEEDDPEDHQTIDIWLFTDKYTKKNKAYFSYGDVDIDFDNISNDFASLKKYSEHAIRVISNNLDLYSVIDKEKEKAKPLYEFNKSISLIYPQNGINLYEARIIAENYIKNYVASYPSIESHREEPYQYIFHVQFRSSHSSTYELFINKKNGGIIFIPKLPSFDNYDDFKQNVTELLTP